MIHLLNLSLNPLVIKLISQVNIYYLKGNYFLDGKGNYILIGYLGLFEHESESVKYIVNVRRSGSNKVS